MHPPRVAAILLGPTGSGKTPLGEMLAARGFRGTPCVHFDFGENLRQAVVRNQPDGTVSAADIEFLKRVLRTGALLEDSDFPVAERILRSFLASAALERHTIVVMNGLPRHIGQARSLASILDPQIVLLLKCSPQTVVARITANTGGDRAHRVDDDLPAITQKLQIFAERTRPLVEYYRAAGATIQELEVTSSMTAEQMWSRLQAPSGAARQ